MLAGRGVESLHYEATTERRKMSCMDGVAGKQNKSDDDDALHRERDGKEETWDW